MAVDFDGDLLMQMGDKMAMDTDSGELHIIYSLSLIHICKNFQIGLIVVPVSAII